MSLAPERLGVRDRTGLSSITWRECLAHPDQSEKREPRATDYMGTTYYASAAKGNNNNPGNQPDKPLRTIQAAINKAQAGDRVAISGGGTRRAPAHPEAGRSMHQPSLPHKRGNQPSSMARTVIPRDTAMVAVQQKPGDHHQRPDHPQRRRIGLAISKSSQITVRETTVDSSYARWPARDAER